MNDAISREATIKTITEYYNMVLEDYGFKIGFDDIKGLIQKIPSVEPTRPQGEVVNYQEETQNGFRPKKYICSNCGAELQGVTRPRPHSGWIPVTERLPKDDGWYLVSLGNDWWQDGLGKVVNDAKKKIHNSDVRISSFRDGQFFLGWLPLGCHCPNHTRQKERRC